jgi:hypothetical protein
LFILLLSEQSVGTKQCVSLHVTVEMKRKDKLEMETLKLSFTVNRKCEIQIALRSFSLRNQLLLFLDVTLLTKMKQGHLITSSALQHFAVTGSSHPNEYVESNQHNTTYCSFKLVCILMVT